MTAGNANQNRILVDGRWSGTHGIGRFSNEILSRLKNIDILNSGPKPLALKNLVWLPYHLRKRKNQYQVFFTPGFNPVMSSSMRFIFTIHDLIHLHVPNSARLAKKIFYECIMKPAAQRAYKILTNSEYSKQSILEWANISAEKVIVVGVGVSHHFIPEGASYNPGYPYLLHVGNTMRHKNPLRLLKAFAKAKIDPAIRLIFTGKQTSEMAELIKKERLEKRILFSGAVHETELAAYYRGAVALVFPSLLEGFGIPVVEAMACGIPVLTSNITSLPEVAGDAALLIDPYEIDSLAHGIEQITQDQTLRNNLINAGLQRAKLFSWDKTVNKVQQVLNEAIEC